MTILARCRAESIAVIPLSPDRTLRAVQRYGNLHAARLAVLYPSSVSHERSMIRTEPKTRVVTAGRVTTTIAGSDSAALKFVQGKIAAASRRRIGLSDATMGTPLDDHIRAEAALDGEIVELKKAELALNRAIAEAESTPPES